MFRKDPDAEPARTLYEAVVSAARNPLFYQKFGVPDTVEGRFELLTVHLYLLLSRLRAEGANSQRLSQAVFDTFFDNMDGSLRELGVGDLSVGKKIRKMAEAFYGRVAAYDAGLSTIDPEALSEAVARNVFGATLSLQSRQIADYMRFAKSALASQYFDELRQGKIIFPVPEDMAP